MTLSRRCFNLYLAGGLTACLGGLLVTGCSTTSSEEKAHKKEASSVRVYLEERFDTGDKTTLVPIYRAKPILIRINKTPVLDEGHLEDARVVDVVGGFAVVLKFDFHGTLVLENLSTAYRGRRLAIYGTFTDSRWLGAPIMNRRITDGRLVFTPDATREEAHRFVRGLNNVAIKLGNKKESSAEPSKGGAF
jgi:preprotein translocase subunit SecD